MLRIVDRYLVRELLVSFIAAVTILLLVTVGATVADLLAKIARGRVAADLLMALVGLRTIDSLTLLVPLGIFLGVQLAYGRLYREKGERYPVTIRVREDQRSDTQAIGGLMVASTLASSKL